MTAMKIATWNINSVRLRVDLVQRFLRAHDPDILCLQETKVPDPKFPTKIFHDLGYEHIAMNGQKGYHGVATVSRIPFDATHKESFCGKKDARHVSVTVGDGIEIHNFYVPSGGDVPDREENEKFEHKLSFLTEMADWLGARNETDRVMVLGDLNVAPGENDVWSHKQMLGVVSHTPIEVEHLDRVQSSRAFLDITRTTWPEPEKVYTWWSYRARDWAASNRGRRLDHIWVTPALEARAGAVEIIRDARGWERPSDHVPVMMTIGAA
ncbi:MAG: exodeoxyribonuclease III [Alphaproteobacteria bacterium]